MNFASPQMFWLLVALVLPLIAFFWWAWRERQRLITQFISARLLAHLKVGVSPGRQKARMAMIVAAVALLVIALARPQWGFTQEEARQRGLDIIVAVDTSNSMLAEDVQPNRLARAKLAALDLARLARTDRLGLVAFAGDAFLECPLTLDDAAFGESVASLDTRTISQGGTAIAEAIDEARRAFKKDSGNHKVLVLFTDGEDHDSEVDAAVQKAVDAGIIIFPIGIGTPEGELLRIRSESGQLDYIRDDQGNPVKSHLNEELLQQMARATKGFYLRLGGAGTMETLYERGIAPLPKSENSARMFQRYRERFYWPLGLAIALLIAEMFLPERKRRRKRAVSPDAMRPAATTAVVETVVLMVLMALLAMPLAAHGAGASGALKEYNAGKFDDALKDYNQLLEKKQDDPRLHFNAGAAAYQGKSMDEAVKQFKDSLNSPDLQLQQRAYYNLGNSFYRLGQGLSDPDKKQEAWDNALKQYTNALSLDRNDGDAQFNQSFVQRQLEQLKQQQSQSQSQDDKQKQDQNKDQKQNQQNQNGNDSQKDQQKDSQSKQDQNQDKQNQDSQSKNPDQQKQPDQQKPDQSQAQNKPDQQKQQPKPDKQQGQDQSQAGGESKDKSDEDAKREAAMMAAGEMTPKQAQQLLDSQKQDEQVLRLAPPNKNTLQNRSYKNW